MGDVGVEAITEPGDFGCKVGGFSLVDNLRRRPEESLSFEGCCLELKRW